MPVIKFSEMYDKLKPENRKSGTPFTTFRAYDVRKCVYYHKNKGVVFDIELNGEKIGSAKLSDMDTEWSYKLSDGFVKRDTYKDWDDNDFGKLMEKFYGTDEVFGIILELEWV